MIDSYASAWGVLPGPGGKVVWALVHGSRSN
jgi:hypothetical protein